MELEILSLRSEIKKLGNLPMSDYIKLGDLEIYQIAVELSDLSWDIYERMEWQNKKIIGDQFIRATDSIGANIAEGYGRYHHKDKIKFYYNSRGSLLESKHWTLLLAKRKLISKTNYDKIMSKLEKLHKKLNLFIGACCKNIK
ncbi:MAG: four helix bundle protein [Candidatus Falkowbacteria bacterium]